MKKCYIFYVFNSLTKRNVDLAIESIANQEFDPYDLFWLYNVSKFENKVLLDQASGELKGKFMEFKECENVPSTNSVCQDLQFHLKKDGFDFYMCHKADFYLNKNMINNADKIANNEKDPFYEGCAKFDLREYVKTDTVRKFASMTFDEVASRDDACGTIFSEKFKQSIAIGYQGHDGSMHFYNDAARRKLRFNSYWRKGDFQANKDNGIDMRHGNKDTFVLHVFHDIPRADPRKRQKGNRF